MNITETACASVATSTLVGEARYVADRSKDPGHCNRGTRRQYWFQADVRCMLCERSIGRVLAVAGFRRDAPVAYWPVLAFFISAQPGARTLRIRGGERFQCTTCGGNGVVEQVEHFTTEMMPDGTDNHPRRGRPPKKAAPRADWRLKAFEITDR